jgi:hypothetical protein
MTRVNNILSFLLKFGSNTEIITCHASIYIVINLCSQFNFKCHDFQLISLNFHCYIPFLIYIFLQLFHDLLNYIRCIDPILFIATLIVSVGSLNFIF